ncbi:hypothetical protein [Parapedobacter soli]|uniref:hypothetical protein n=1 Tax=Parapedobacter soli TaxID=416955 RepID=UPI0021C786DC|nr:hypothetical protein [Parapedobacter soli]
MKDFREIIVLLLLIALVGCNRSELPQCADGITIPIRTPFGEATPCNPEIEEIDYEQAIVFANREDVEKLNFCSEEVLDGIDFEKEYLVAVRACSACGILRKQQVRLHCDRLIYSIEIENTICAAITCSNYFVVIPREYLNYPIEMDITKTN